MPDESSKWTADWFLQNGANMCWTFARVVQPAIEDAQAAQQAGDPLLSIEASLLVLRAVFTCELVAATNAARSQEHELNAGIARSTLPVAVAIRNLEKSSDFDRETAAHAVTTALRFADDIRRRLPFDMPEIRKEGTSASTMRLAATLGKLRTERGMGSLEWTWE